MKTFKFYLFLVFALLSLSHCSKKQLDCETIKNIKIEKLSSIVGLSLNVMNQTEVDLVIKSQQDYQKYVFSTTTLPEIDFRKYILVCGKYTSNTCASLFNQEVNGNCTNLNYEITIQKQLCQAVITVYHFALIPIQYTDYSIGFNYTIKQ